MAFFITFLTENIILSVIKNNFSIKIIQEILNN